MVYVALLRGINVGGNNRVEMARLKIIFEKNGLKDTKTYINSGNVIFKSELKDEKGITNKIEAAILKEFGFKVPVVVRNLKNIKAVNKSVPAKWTNDQQQKTDVMFLWDEVNKSDVHKQFNINPDFETLFYVDGALVWNVNRKYITKSKMLKIAGTAFYKQVTIRNINTVRKLQTLMEEYN